VRHLPEHSTVFSVSGPEPEPKQQELQLFALAEPEPELENGKQKSKKIEMRGELSVNNDVTYIEKARFVQFFCGWKN
jgi:hypothetical protein